MKTQNWKFVWPTLALIFLSGFCFFGAVTILYAEPGDIVYPLNQQIDKLLASLPADPETRVRTQLDLANRQMADVELAITQSPQLVETILAEWERTVKEAIFNLAEVAPTAQKALLELLAQTVRHNIETMTHLQSGATADVALILAKKITVGDNIYRYATARPVNILALLTLVGNPVPASRPVVVMPTLAPDSVRLDKPGDELLTNNLPVVFPPGTALEHPFPLDGKHGQIACEACHTQGIYVGLPNLCTDCHSSQHPSEFSAETCRNCHQLVDWNPFLPIDHSFRLEGGHITVSCRACHPNDNYKNTPSSCQGCHALDDPHQGRFGLQCNVCHISHSWQQVDFDHISLPSSSCQDCHNRPDNHYEGQCSICHVNNKDWQQIQFDHTGLTNCLGCHSADSPTNHYSGQCAVCHTSNKDWQQTQFNHAGFSNCLDCHNVDSPVNHYSGQCGDCHNSFQSWGQVSFNHTGFSDCQACHNVDRPANHYTGQCSSCHLNTVDWKQASFNHTGFSDCQACHNVDRPASHYPGQCSLCHTSTLVWSQIEFTHTDTTDCESCHFAPRYPQHYNGRCVQCHTSTTTWQTYSFDHAGQEDCQFCHARPQYHPPGQCDMCHLPSQPF